MYKMADAATSVPFVTIRESSNLFCLFGITGPRGLTGPVRIGEIRRPRVGSRLKGAHE
jgi:hypothetical protein